MNKKYGFLLIYFFLYSFLSCTCDRKFDPLSTAEGSYVTSSGSVMQIDDYPLFTLQYTADYYFDEYLHTGTFPDFAYNFSRTGNYSCTCFSAFGENTRLFGRNYDWSDAATYFVVFTDPPDGYASVSAVDLGFFGYDQSKSPSSPDNQDILRLLPYFPFDGMNEKGVAVGMNALSRAHSPHDTSKVSIGELQLIRLVLDYAASTQEALSLIRQYNILMEEPPIHYLIADSAGHSAILEFVEGAMVVMENMEQWQVTTNFIITGLTDPENAPCWRYRTAHEMLRNNDGILAESDAIELLHTVSVSSTRWSWIFDMKSGVVQICTGRDYENMHHFNVF